MSDPPVNVGLFARFVEEEATQKFPQGWHPKLHESELTQFEQRFSITLPEQYRYFLKHIGNGTPRPFEERDWDIEEIFPLDLDMNPDDRDNPFSSPHRPFLWQQEADAREADSLAVQGHGVHETLHDSEQTQIEEKQLHLFEILREDHLPRVRAALAPEFRTCDKPVITQGCLVLSRLPSTSKLVLIVTGPFRGTVWQIYTLDAFSVQPVFGSFLEFLFCDKVDPGAMNLMPFMETSDIPVLLESQES